MRAPPPFAPRRVAMLQPEGDIVDDAPPGKQARVLEHERDRLAAIACAGDAHRPGRRPRQIGDDAQEGRFAHARRADDRKKFAAANIEIELAQHIRPPAVALEGKRESLNLDHAFHRNNHPCSATNAVSRIPYSAAMVSM